LANDLLWSLLDDGYFARPEVRDDPTEKLLYIDFDMVNERDETQYFLPLNILKQPYDKYKVARNVVEICRRVWPYLRDGVPQFENILLNTIIVLIDNDLPLTKLQKVLNEKEYRDALLAQVSDPDVVGFFKHRSVARARTLTILNRGFRGDKTGVLRFLYESGLIGGDQGRVVVDLTGADLYRIDFSSQDLSGIDLDGAHVYDAVLAETDLRDAKLSEATLTNAQLMDADLTGATITQARLTNAKMPRANMTNVSLVDVDLRCGYLEAANLTDADLSGAQLYGANLRQAEGLTQDQLDRAYGDEDTVLPEDLSTPPSWLESYAPTGPPCPSETYRAGAY